MTDWNDFLKLVPQAALRKLPDPASETADTLERRTSAQFEAEVAESDQKMARLARLTTRQPWEAVPPQEAYLAGLRGLHDRLTRCHSFDAVAEQLRAAGRPTFGGRLRTIIADTERAIAICSQIARDAGVNRQQIADIGVKAGQDAIASMLRMNESMKKMV
jgi:hypothetical protein